MTDNPVLSDKHGDSLKGTDHSDKEESRSDYRSTDSPDSVQSQGTKPSISQAAPTSDVKTEDSTIHSGGSQDQPNESKSLTELGKVERINVRLATGVFLTGLLGAIIIFLQLCEMKKANESAAESARAATVQANLARNAADESKRLNEEAANRAERATAATENAARSMASQAEASSKAANSTERVASAAKRSAEAAEKSFSIGERPYVAYKQAKIKDLATDRRPSVDIIFDNSGRTPGLNSTIRCYAKYRPFSEGTKLGEVTYPPPPDLSVQTIQPGCCTLNNVPLVVYDRLVSDFGEDTAKGIINSVIEEVQNKKVRLFIYGVVEYDDGASKHHTLKFCVRYDRDNDSFPNCPDHNGSN
jgi:hypothetical protein